MFDRATQILVQGVSLPGGVYRWVPSPELERGRVTLVCVGGDQAMWLRERYYGRSAYDVRCVLPQVAMAKVLMAIPGDTVVVTPDSVHVVGVTSVAAARNDFDRDARPMPSAVGEHVLREGECFMLSTWHPRSIDSRYLGPLPCPETPHHLIPRSDKVAATVTRWTAHLMGRDE